MPNHHRAIELLRWAGVPPAALLGGFAAKILSNVVVHTISGVLSLGGAVDPRGFGYYPYLMLALIYVPWGAAPVIAGAWMAPESRLAVAVVLAAAVTLISLQAHILGQSTVGFENYTHFAAESSGAAVGVLLLRRWTKKESPPAPG